MIFRFGRTEGDVRRLAFLGRGRRRRVLFRDGGSDRIGGGAQLLGFCVQLLVIRDLLTGGVKEIEWVRA